MKTFTDHPVVASYLSEFDMASSELSAARRLELREEVAGHLREAIPLSLPSAEAADVIAQFGSPAEIVGQELSVNRSGKVPRSSKVGRTVALTVAAVAAAVVVVAVLFWLFWEGDSPEGGSTNGGSPAAVTSVVNRSPNGPDRIQEGTGYYEYLAAIEAMPDPLPAGAEYPDGVPEGLDSGATVAGGVAESGAGANVARFTWLCAWEAEYLSAILDEDAERQVAAEAMLTKWPTFDYVADPEGGWKENVIEPMSFGDASGVQRDFPQTCSQAGILNVDASLLP